MLNMNQITYHYLVMAQKDLLENQCFEEVVREKTGYFSSRKKQRNFWLILSPKFLFSPEIYNQLKLSKFYEQKKSIISSSLVEKGDFFVSLVSPDKEFVNWIALRLGYFENIDNNHYLNDIKEKNFSSDGVRGTFVLSKENPPKVSLLKGYPNYLHPDILLKRNKKFLEFYYKIFHKNELKI